MSEGGPKSILVPLFKEAQIKGRSIDARVLVGCLVPSKLSAGLPDPKSSTETSPAVDVFELCNEGLVGVVEALLPTLYQHHCVDSAQPLQGGAQGLVGEDSTNGEDVLALQPVVLHDARQVVDQQFHERLDVIHD